MMQILVHIGLNKCASTYTQESLRAAQSHLRRNGVLYPVEGARPAQYGVSRYYGFGPNDPDIKPRDVTWLSEQAEKQGCERVILSSEFFSIAQPKAIHAFARDLDALNVEARIFLFTREIFAWIRSIFNQHVKTQDGGPYFSSINAFVDHALRRGIINIARRYYTWANVFGEHSIEHYHIETGQAPETVLRPFADFAGTRISPAPNEGDNRSLSPGALYLTGLVRRAPPSRSRNLVLSSIAKQDCSWVVVPDDYLEIDADRLARLEEQIVAPFAALPRKELPTAHAA